MAKKEGGRDMGKIDFVITWVDGNDPKWLKTKAEYSATQGNDPNRFRDMGIFNYWFRAVEMYAPWVRKIHFVTYGHVPEWLNIDNEKIHIVKHEDYIPREYLPTFNSHTIEMFLHRIEGLSDTFVYFNDDVFLNAPVKEKDFFVNGIPKDECVESALLPKGNSSQFSNINANTVYLINKSFNKRKVFRKHPLKYLNLKYGIDNIRTLTMLPYPEYSLFKNPHICNAYIKTTFEEVWQEYPNELSAVCRNKFRTNTDVNQYIFRFWQFMKGNFIPRKTNFGTTYELNNSTNEKAYSDIVKKKHKIVCLNDSDVDLDVKKVSEELTDILNKKFPDKSTFER